MSRDYKTIDYKKRNQTAWITLDRSDKLNAINTRMLEELSEVIDYIQRELTIDCIIISSGDKKAFSVGADLMELQKLNSETATEFSAKGQQLFIKMEELPKPIIAAINGYVLGGGLELALSCDFRIATNNAELGFPEIKFGFIPAWGGTLRLPRIIGEAAAKKMIMSGERIPASDALRNGLVDKIVFLDKLIGEAEKLANIFGKYSPSALNHLKPIIKMTTNSSFIKGLMKETEIFASLISRNETKKNIAKFLAERKNR